MSLEALKKVMVELDILSARVAALESKERRKTVRSKRPVQQLKAEIATLYSWYVNSPPLDLHDNLLVLLEKLRQLSAV